MSQLEREVEELLIKELFLAYNKNGGHTVDRHMNISKRKMIARAEKKHEPSNDLAIVSRFSTELNLDDIIKMIHRCVLENLDDIKKWVKTPNKSKELICSFDAPIGECVVKNTDMEFIPCSNLCVALGDSHIKGRLFNVISAYPCPNWDESDIAWNKRYPED